jgi:16S rRNA (adenine1518-N6/adenine1519-N6)-dimethyltransferase
MISLASGADEHLFFRVVRAGFSQRRKTLRNALRAGLHLRPEVAAERLKEAGVDPQLRAETLSLQEWAAVTESMVSVIE